jgi:hypothetical protein
VKAFHPKSFGSGDKSNDGTDNKSKNEKQEANYSTRSTASQYFNSILDHYKVSSYLKSRIKNILRHDSPPHNSTIRAGFSWDNPSKNTSNNNTEIREPFRPNPTKLYKKCRKAADPLPSPPPSDPIPSPTPITAMVITLPILQGEFIGGGNEGQRESWCSFHGKGVEGLVVERLEGFVVKGAKKVGTGSGKKVRSVWTQTYSKLLKNSASQTSPSSQINIIDQAIIKPSRLGEEEETHIADLKDWLKHDEDDYRLLRNDQTDLAIYLSKPAPSSRQPVKTTSQFQPSNTLVVHAPLQSRVTQARDIIEEEYRERETNSLRDEIPFPENNTQTPIEQTSFMNRLRQESIEFNLSKDRPSQPLADEHSDPSKDLSGEYIDDRVEGSSDRMPQHVSIHSSKDEFYKDEQERRDNNPEQQESSEMLEVEDKHYDGMDEDPPLESPQDHRAASISSNKGYANTAPRPQAKDLQPQPVFKAQTLSQKKPEPQQPSPQKKPKTQPVSSVPVPKLNMNFKKGNTPKDTDSSIAQGNTSGGKNINNQQQKEMCGLDRFWMNVLDKESPNSPPLNIRSPDFPGREELHANTEKHAGRPSPPKKFSSIIKHKSVRELSTSKKGSSISNSKSPTKKSDSKNSSTQRVGASSQKEIPSLGNLANLSSSRANQTTHLLKDLAAGKDPKNSQNTLSPPKTILQIPTLSSPPLRPQGTSVDNQDMDGGFASDSFQQQTFRGGQSKDNIHEEALVLHGNYGKHQSPSIPRHGQTEMVIPGPPTLGAGGHQSAGSQRVFNFG